MIPLTAELFARAIIASAVSYGDDPVEACTAADRRRRRALAPALYGLREVTGASLATSARILGVNATAAAVSRNRGGERFARAVSAASEALRWHLASRFAAAPPPEPQSAPTAPETPRQAVQARPVPKPAPRPQISRSTNARAIPRGARIENRGEGVQVIRLKPVTDSIARHAKAQIDRGLDLEEAAELFGVAPESLQRAIAAMSGGAAA